MFVIYNISNLPKSVFSDYSKFRKVTLTDNFNVFQNLDYGMPLPYYIVDNIVLGEEELFENHHAYKKYINISAVKENGMALQFIESQDEDICATAVHENGLALQYVKDKTAKIIRIAIKQNGMAIEFSKS